MSNMNETYFEWLTKDIPGITEYSSLMFTLCAVDYFYDKEMVLDGPRAQDGLKLRAKYILGTNHISELDSYTITSRPCTVLEWLIGLAQKTEEMMDNDEEGDRTWLWFWSMIENMGLDIYTNEHWDENSTSKVLDHVNKVMGRFFDADGSGSPFPLREKSIDVRECDWWLAMNLWLNENFSEEINDDDVDELG